MKINEHTLNRWDIRQVSLWSEPGDMVGIQFLPMIILVKKKIKKNV